MYEIVLIDPKSTRRAEIKRGLSGISGNLKIRAFSSLKTAERALRTGGATCVLYSLTDRGLKGGGVADISKALSRPLPVILIVEPGDVEAGKGFAVVAEEVRNLAQRRGSQGHSSTDRGGAVRRRGERFCQRGDERAGPRNGRHLIQAHRYL